MKNNIEVLKKKYEDICNEYVKIFCEKQEMEFEFWVGDVVGEVAFICDYYFSFRDIKYDIDNNIKKGKIVDYYENCIDEQQNVVINYKSWLKTNKKK